MNIGQIYAQPIQNRSKETIIQLEQLIDDEKNEELSEIAKNLNQVEIADIILFIDFDHLPNFIKLVENRLDHHMIPNIDEDRTMTFFETIGIQRFAELVNKFENYEFYDFIHHHQDLEDYEELYENLTPQKQKILDDFLAYPKESAGRLMQENIIYASMEWNIRQIKDFIKHSPNISTNVERVFLIDNTKKIQGSISLARLLKTNSDIIAKEIMNVKFTVVKVTDSQKKVLQLFQRYSLSYILVSGHDDAIIGAISSEDIIDILENQVDQNFIRSQYLTNGENIVQNKQFLSSIMVRVPWLIINIGLSTLVSSFVARFTDVFEKHIALTIIIPIIASISGISGAQTIASTIHTLAKSDIEKKNILKTFSHEIFVSVTIAFLIASLSGLTTYFRFGKEISILHFSAMFLDFCVASLSGIFIPLLTYFVFKWDPAIISPILVTTLSDFFAYFFAILIAFMILS